MKVIGMKKMPKGRYKLTMDDSSDLILYEEVVINNVILIGKTIDKDLKDKIMLDNYRATPYQQALSYIDSRMRSREEIRNLLTKKGYEYDLIDDTISRLEKDGYINDEAFAKAYIRDKLTLSNDGINKIKRSLSNYGVSDNIIDNISISVDEEELHERVEKLIAKQLRLNKKYTGNMLKNRILNYLVNLGYDSGMILDHLNSQSFKDNSNIEKEYQKLYKKYANKYSGYKLDMTIKQHLYQKGYDASDIEKITK